MSEDQQAVANDTDVDATPSAEENGAQEKTVDELLAEFDSPEPKSEVKETPKEAVSKVELSSDQRKEIMDGLRTEMQFEDDIGKVVEDIKGDLNVEPEYVRWKLEELARNDDRVWKAFLARNTNPSAWNAIVKNVKGDMSSKFSAPAVTDKEKIASAVHSATNATGSSQATDIKKMSSADFEINKEKLLKEAMKGQQRKAKGEKKWL